MIIAGRRQLVLCADNFERNGVLPVGSLAGYAARACAADAVGMRRHNPKQTGQKVHITARGFSSATAVVTESVGDHSERSLRHVRIPLPSQAALDASGGAIVRLTMSTICGSDLHTLAGKRPSEPIPLVLGHEGLGVVEAVAASPSDSSGAGARVSVGQRVTFSIADSCGHCVNCTPPRLLPQKCKSLMKYGHAPLDGHAAGLSGTFASHIVLKPGTEVVPVPDVVPDALAAPANCALATSMACCNAVTSESISAAADPEQLSVLIQGAGMLGLYAVAILRAMGLERIVVTDVIPERLALAREFGATAVHSSDADAVASAVHAASAGGDGVDVAMELCGVPDVLAAGVAALRPGGRYVLAGLAHPQSSMADVTADALIRKCATVTGQHNYQAQDLRDSVEFLEAACATPGSGTGSKFSGAAGLRPLLERLVSPPLPLSRLAEAIELAEAHAWLRVAVDPQS